MEKKYSVSLADRSSFSGELLIKGYVSEGIEPKEPHEIKAYFHAYIGKRSHSRLRTAKLSQTPDMPVARRNIADHYEEGASLRNLGFFFMDDSKWDAREDFPFADIITAREKIIHINSPVMLADRSIPYLSVNGNGQKIMNSLLNITQIYSNIYTDEKSCFTENTEHEAEGFFDFLVCLIRNRNPRKVIEDANHKIIYALKDGDMQTALEERLNIMDYARANI